MSIQQLAQKAPIMPRPAGMRLQAPASFQQTALYAAEHLSSCQRTDYNVLIAFGAIGNLDITALKKALSFLWHRHQVLRTGLIFQVPQFLIFFYRCNSILVCLMSQAARADGCRLLQVIRSSEEPGGTIPLEVWDCSNGWNSCGFNSTADFITALEQHVARPFDMAVEMV
ncbi:MAG: hypothetical protein GY746_00010, partial [Gammaproteobacteria bacterium]|nr:hypothetical protein [Gammaproteobacteria bacterium]